MPSDSETKHDSFLEDVGLIPGAGNYWPSSKNAERNITKRSTSPMTDSQFSSMILKEEEFEEKNNRDAVQTIKGQSNQSSRREIGSGDRLYREDLKGAKFVEDKQGEKSRLKSRYGESKTSENKSKLQNDKSKLNVDKKSSTRRSGGSKDKEQSPDASDDRKQASVRAKQSVLVISEGNRDQQRRSDAGAKNSKEISDSVALLNAVKEIVSTYTKEESIKITKMMNELHILSQANIIKNFIFQTDEIRKSYGNSGEYRALIEENRILRENVEILKLRYENAQRELEERERVKEENNALRLRIQELLARTSS